MLLDRVLIDGRSDLYGLGIVLYEALTGKLPYGAENTVGIAPKIVTAPVPELPEALKQYQALLDNLLAKDPANRYQAAEALIADIEQLQSGKTMERPSHAAEVVPSIGGVATVVSLIVAVAVSNGVWVVHYWQV
jgi:serine/threonine protein kinase